jgi:hypothetical protein
VIAITETTVGSLGGVRVAIGNIFVQDYRDSDNEVRNGPAAMVSVPGSPRVLVGAGSRLRLASGDWDVVDVTPVPENRGRITFASG